MRSHAKAPTAGPTQRQAKGLGRNRFAKTAVLAFAIVSLLALAATPASAAGVRSYESSFGSFTGENPQALAVDQSGGDVYALDTENGAVERFDSSGAPENFTAGPNAGTNTLTGFAFDSPSAAQVAVDSSGGATDGDIYVADSFGGGVKVFANDGSAIGTIDGSTNFDGFFSEPCGVAVDQSNGDVYVGDYGIGIWRYTPSGADVTNADYSGGVFTGFAPCQVAAEAGKVYAIQWSTGPLYAFAASDFATGEPPFPTPTEISSSANAVAADPSNGDVYVDKGETISVFDSAGASLYSFGSSADFESSRGVAVREGAGVYVADPAANQIDLFGAPSPTPTTEAASEVHHVRAKLNGHLALNGGSPITDCHFEWGTDTSYGNSAPCAEGNSFSAPADVSAEITGLTAGETYHFRLDVSNSDGEVNGEDESFTTPAVIRFGLIGTFGESGSGDGQFSQNSGIAIDQPSGDLYVADTGNHRIEKLDADGNFIAAWGEGQLTTPKFVAVDNSGGPSDGDVYVADTTTNTVSKFDSSGNFISSNDGSSSGSAFGPLAGIAVDTSGNLWVYDENADMREFGQDGSFVTKWNSGYGVQPRGIAVDTTGHLYVVRGSPIVEKLTSAGVDLGRITDESISATGLAIDPVSDDLYVDAASSFEAAGGTKIDRFASSCDPSGGTCSIAESFGSGDLEAAGAVAVNGSSGRVYVSDPDRVKIFQRATFPDVITGSASATSATSASLNGAVAANGLALTDCHFEYVADHAFLASGFKDLSSGGSVPCDQALGSFPTDFEEHPVSATVTGLDPTVVYHFRLFVANAEVSLAGQPALIPGPPLVETTGSPTRTATTARLDSRLDPRGIATTYRFEYGDQGPCDANPCTATTSQPAGSGEEFEFVSQRIAGLKANTTYHYRLLADNGTPGGPAFGEDMILTTRASDAPLTHGRFPGPTGSDRAWEQVSVPDTGGNGIYVSLAIADDGERALYSVLGGTPVSEVGASLFGDGNQLYAERTSSGWRFKQIYPGRAKATGSLWGGQVVTSSADLSRIFARNYDNTGSESDSTSVIWDLSPEAAPQPVLAGGGNVYVSKDGSRVISVAGGFFDITSGSPRRIDLLPDDSIPGCGRAPAKPTDGEGRWISADGSHVVFFAGDSSCSDVGLYIRDLEAEVTSLVAHAGSLLGPTSSFLRLTPDAVFFASRESLLPEDVGGNDVYRYDLDEKSLDCVTCFGTRTDVESPSGEEDASRQIAVSEDGSRVYFTSRHRLVPGAADHGLYRVDVASGELVYVAPLSAGGQADHAGIDPNFSNAITPDGSVYVFSSSAAGLNYQGGPQNGGTVQYYLYDDDNRSLVCVSCPVNGGAPRGEAPETLSRFNPISNDGTLLFATPTALIPADQNTAARGEKVEVGMDVYEWRDGRPLLVSDGLAGRTGLRPEAVAMTPSGRDAFFAQGAQLTPDSIDGFRHLYDARIGGGFEFPTPPPPCGLEVCQGTPRGVPEESRPGSADYAGAGNGQSGAARCRKGKVRRSGRCVARPHKRTKKHRNRAQHRANHDRRASR